jgi:hypothetical protein
LWQVNPCNSKLHPAFAEAGIAIEGTESSVQEAYTPNGTCFGCGPSHPDGLHLRSMRHHGGLQAHVSVPKRYCAFPGILNGGIISTLLDWCASTLVLQPLS